MTSIIWASILSIMILAGPLPWHQEDMRIISKDEKSYNRIQAMRIWTIINALDIDPTSETGIAVLDTIKKHSDVLRQVYARKAEIISELENLYHHEKELDEAQVDKLILEYEDLQRQLLANFQEEMERMAELLTPLQRAKMLIAEEKFKQHLRNAIQRMGPRHGRGQYRDKY